MPSSTPTMRPVNKSVTGLLILLHTCSLLDDLKSHFLFCSVVDYHSWPTACLPAVSLWFDLICLPVWILLLFSCILDRPSVSVWPLNVPVGRLCCNKVWVGSSKPTVLWEVVHGGLNIWRFWSFSWMINHPRLKKKKKSESEWEYGTFKVSWQSAPTDGINDFNDLSIRKSSTTWSTAITWNVLV